MSANKKIHKLNSNQIQELQQAFALFDTDRSGSISVSELNQVLHALGVSISAQEVRQMFSAIDVDSKIIDFKIRTLFYAFCFYFCRKWFAIKKLN
ncbi:unnamed protein product [Rotaria magnacalcarata]|uniref:EF-hand domain-containing protein n=1 Tax=Rotaria magnacalcarata TaxID=392030 RepID=A0A8S2Y4T1_9BILA|nr:unnamed protein product [Rotaria magnacalcarata]